MKGWLLNKTYMRMSSFSAFNVKKENALLVSLWKTLNHNITLLKISLGFLKVNETLIRWNASSTSSPFDKLGRERNSQNIYTLQIKKKISF